MSGFGLFSPFRGAMILFKLGFVPQEGDFLELTNEQYQHFYNTAEDADSHRNEKLFMLLPQDLQIYAEVAAGDALILSEGDIALIKGGVDFIENCCAESGEKFNTFDEKLRFCADKLPAIATDGTKYEKFKIKRN
jgi:hypothetical protein